MLCMYTRTHSAPTKHWFVTIQSMPVVLLVTFVIAFRGLQVRACGPVSERKREMGNGTERNGTERMRHDFV